MQAAGVGAVPSGKSGEPALTGDTAPENLDDCMGRSFRTETRLWGDGLTTGRLCWC